MSLRFFCDFTKGECACPVCKKCIVEVGKTFIFRDHGIPVLHGHRVTSALANEALDFSVSLFKKRRGFQVKTLQQLSGLNILSTMEKARLFFDEGIAVLPLPGKLKQILSFLDINFVYANEPFMVPTMLAYHIGSEIYLKGYSEKDYEMYRKDTDEMFL